ncbi:MAG: carbohydrate-binding domain-containing protein [Ruminococcus sp.]
MKQQSQRIAWAIIMALSASAFTTGCTNNAVNPETAQTETMSETESTEITGAAITSAETKTSEKTDSTYTVNSRTEYDEDDMTCTYDSFDAEIKLSGTSAEVTGSKDSVQTAGSDITITKGGTYYISGTLADGQLRVSGTEKVKLYLDGVSVSNSDGAALVCTNEKRTVISLADGSDNSFSDGGSYTISDEDAAAAVYAKDKLTINGIGTLNVNGNVSEGIVSKDDLKITGGLINVNAANNGVKGTDSVSVCGGSLNIISGNDALKSTKADNAEKGWVAIDGGSIDINAGGDGIQAESTLEITAGQINIVTTGEIVTDSNDDFGGMQGGRGGMPFSGDIPEDRNETAAESAMPAAFMQTSDTSQEDSASSKGLKSCEDLTVSGGTFTINSTDHCIHSGGAMNITGGNLALSSSSAKGISSHGELTVSGSETAINIEKCTEGIESKSVMNIDGGNIRILGAADDGFNTGGSENPDHTMNINGGTVYINSSCDGVDSNGDINFSGGLLIVSGPTSGGDGSLDSDGTMTLSGGTVLGLSSHGMMEYPAGCMMTTSLNVSAGETISVTDKDGNLIIAVKTPKEVSDVIFADGSGNDMTSYKLFTGGTFSGSMSEDGWATEGSMENGTECSWSMAETAGGGMMGGHGGFGGKGNMAPPDSEGMTPPGGFDGERPFPKQ